MNDPHAARQPYCAAYLCSSREVAEKLCIDVLTDYPGSNLQMWQHLDPQWIVTSQGMMRA